MKIFFQYYLLLLIMVSPSVAVSQLITVNGVIDPGEMGITLIHEHVMVDWIGADSTGYHRWDRSEIVRRALPYMEELKDFGVTSFLDCTPVYLGRDPFVLKELSQRTGIHILTNTGYYGAGENKYIPEAVKGSSPREMAAQWIREFEEGIDSSGIRPGFIKISVGDEENLSRIHRNLVKAAALTHLETGMTIVSHTGTDVPAMAQIDLLRTMGVSPSAFVWTHAQRGTISGYLRAAEQGAWISLDNINGGKPDEPDSPGNISWFVETLLTLKDEGILDHILISHDSGWYNVGQMNGGDYRGYTDLFTKLIPNLRANGFTEADIDMLLMENPKRAYALQVRK